MPSPGACTPLTHTRTCSRAVCTHSPRVLTLVASAHGHTRAHAFTPAGAYLPLCSPGPPPPGPLGLLWPRALLSRRFLVAGFPPSLSSQTGQGSPGGGGSGVGGRGGAQRLGGEPVLGSPACGACSFETAQNEGLVSGAVHLGPPPSGTPPRHPPPPAPEHRREPAHCPSAEGFGEPEGQFPLESGGASAPGLPLHGSFQDCGPPPPPRTRPIAPCHRGCPVPSSRVPTPLASPFGQEKPFSLVQGPFPPTTLLSRPPGHPELLVRLPQGGTAPPSPCHRGTGRIRGVKEGWASPASPFLPSRKRDTARGQCFALRDALAPRGPPW